MLTPTIPLVKLCYMRTLLKFIPEQLNLWTLSQVVSAMHVHLWTGAMLQDLEGQGEEEEPDASDVVAIKL